jgi:hypothetical protein
MDGKDSGWTSIYYYFLLFKVKEECKWKFIPQKNIPKILFFLCVAFLLEKSILFYFLLLFQVYFLKSTLKLAHNFWKDFNCGKYEIVKRLDRPVVLKLWVAKKIMCGEKLSKFFFPNYQNFPFQTVKIFLSKLSKFSFSNCQNFSFQTVKIFLSKLSKFSFPNCQNFPFQTVKIFLSNFSKFSFSNCQNFPFPKFQKFYFQTGWRKTGWCVAKF